MTSVQPVTMTTLVKSFLGFVAHPGTNTGLGVSLAALAQFTALVPPADRTAPTLMGLGYALAVQILDWLKIATA